MFFYFFSVNPASVQKYVTAQKNSSPANTVVDVGQARADWSMKNFNVLIPKSKFSQAYGEAFNLAFNELEVLDSTNRTVILPEMVKIKSYSAAKDYNAITLSMAKIASLNEIQKKREVILANYLKSFAAANNGTADKEANQLTADFISAAGKMNDAYIAFSVMLDGLASGKISEQLAGEAQKTTETLVASKADFMAANKKLVDFFVSTLQADAKN